VGGDVRRWSFDGYRPATVPAGEVWLVTPPSTLRALAAGYRAKLHASAVGPTP